MFTGRSVTPEVLFKTQLHYGITGSRNDYLVTANGQRFLVNTPLQDTANLPITVVLNWTKPLEK